MYNVSQAYKAALAAPVHRYKLRGTIRDIDFSEADVLQSSLTITNKCSNDGEVEIGGIYAAEMHVTFVNDLGMSRYSWVGSEITLEEGLHIGAGTYEYVPCGSYLVTEANYTSEGIVVTAFDKSSNLDATMSFATISGTAYEIMSLVCDEVDLELANTDFSDFVNAEVIWTLPEQNDLKSYRDLAGAIAQALCGFFTINRDGCLELRMYGSTEVDTIDPGHRFEGGSFSDFVTHYDSISYTDSDGSVHIYTASGADRGLMYEAGKNYLMFGQEEARQAVADTLAEIHFVPFSVGLAGTIAYDLGDPLKFTNGLADGTKLSCIMQYDWVYNASYTAEGFGKNPALYGAQSSEQRQLEQVAQSTVGKGIVFYPLTNGRQVTIRDGATKKSIFSIAFATTDTTNVMLEGQAVVQVPEAETEEEFEKVIAKLTYTLDGEEITTIHPTWTWSETGKHTVTFIYPTYVEERQIHRFSVALEADGSDLTIDAGDIRAVVWGQNLAAQTAWDGTLVFDDEVSSLNIGGTPITLTSISGSITAMALQLPSGAEVIDTVGMIDVGDGISLMPLIDSVGFGKLVRRNTWGYYLDNNFTWATMQDEYIW